MGTELVGCDLSLADDVLIGKTLQGEAQAFRTLYRKHEKRVRSTLRNMCGDALLDDLVQEVFIRVWKHMRGFRSDSKFTTWLFRIVQNVAADCRKDYAVQRSRMEKITIGADDNGTKADNIAEREIVRILLDALDFEHRRILVLVDIEEFSMQESADILGIPLGTVKSRLHYARVQAKEFLLSKGVSL